MGDDRSAAIHRGFDHFMSVITGYFAGGAQPGQLSNGATVEGAQGSITDGDGRRGGQCWG